MRMEQDVLINQSNIYICDTLILNFNLMAQFSLNDVLRDWLPNET